MGKLKHALNDNPKQVKFMPKSNLDQAFVLALAAKYAPIDVLWTDKCDALIDSWGVIELGELSQFHRHVVDQQLLPQISEWLETLEDNFREEPACRLFVLLNRMADREISPFDVPRLEVFNRAQPLDWSKLPEELHYLIPALEKYGHFISEVEVLDYIDGIQDEEVEQLAVLAEQMRISGHSKMINDWQNRFPETEHPESACIWGLLGIMDFLELKW